MVKSSVYHGEDIAYLHSWLDVVFENVLKSKKFASEQQASLYFSISTTFKVKVDRPYVTPLRFSESSFVTGVVVNSINQAILVASVIGDHVDGILVDVEKKINKNFHISKKILKYFDIELRKDELSLINQGCISEYLKFLNPSIDIIHYKPNDLTVDAVWGLLALKLDNFEGKKIAVIGCGNIGFKLALKLVESGADVRICRRDKDKGQVMEEAINYIKPDSCIASIDYFHSAIEASKSCSIVIGTSNGNDMIDSKILENMSNDSILIDVGKGNISANALNKALENGVSVFRADITAALLGFISQFKKSKDFLFKRMGRVSLTSEITILSGGLLGKDGEFVVDDFQNPSAIFGICDGAGNLKSELSSNEKVRMAQLKKHIKGKMD